MSSIVIFQVGDGTGVYLPQFELARALYFYGGYLSRTAMTPEVIDFLGS